MGRDNVKHDVWIGPAAFWAMCYINDRQYLPDDEPPVVEHMQRVRNYNVEFYQTRSPGVASNFRFPHTLYIVSGPWVTSMLMQIGTVTLIVPMIPIGNEN